MTPKRMLSARLALPLVLLAMAGSIAGTLAGPRVVAAFQGATAWLLPAVLGVSVLLALAAGYVALHLATRRRE